MESYTHTHTRSCEKDDYSFEQLTQKEEAKKKKNLKT